MTLLLPLLLLILAAPVIAIVALVKVIRLERRLAGLDRERFRESAHAPRPAAEPPAAPPTPRTQPAPGPPSGPTLPQPGFSVAAGRGGGAPPASPKPPRAGGGDLEVAIGTRWYNIAGIVTLLFGIAFFLKYAYENAWIGPKGRVAIGIACGIVAILLGERTRRHGHRIFSQGLTGGGIAALYLSLFFSFRFYQLIEIAPAFVLLVLVTACGVALAVAQNSLAVAVLSFVGAYLTPVLLSTGQDAAGFLFSYLTVLALGALAVTYFRRWRALDLLAFAGTCILYAGWYEQHYARGRLPVAVAGLAVFFLIFLAIPYGHALARRIHARPEDHGLALGNAAFAFGFLYRMIHPISPRALGFIAVALAACYLGLGIFARRRLADDRRLAVSIFGMSIAFMTLAVPLQLGLHGITLAWAILGLLLIGIGFHYGAWLTRLSGVAVLALAVLRLFIAHTPLHTKAFTLFLNAPFATWTFVVAAVFAAAWLYRRNAGRLDERERPALLGGLSAGLLLLLTGLTLEVRSFLRLWEYAAPIRAAGMMVLWAIYPIAALLLALRLRDRVAHRLSIALLAPALVPFLALLSAFWTRHGPLFGTFAFWAGLLGAASFFAVSVIQRRSADTWTIGAPVHRVLAAAGTALLLLLLTTEVYTFFRYRPRAPDDPTANALRALLSVSVLWALYASALMAIGFRRSDRGARYAAGGLFALTLAKVFFLDVWELREIYRIVSFVVLGLLLVAASYLYSRMRSRIGRTAAGIALLILPAFGQVGADFDAAKWSHVRAIDTAQVEQSGEPFAWVVLDAGVLDGARADLADLRVVGRGREEVPSLVHRRAGGSREETYAPRLVNRVRAAPRGPVSVELDFGSKMVKNLIEVESSGDEFRRRARVEGSDDGRDWRTVVDEAWIYRIPASGSFEGVRHETVRLPDNDQSRLRVTVFPMPGETKPVEIVSVRARRRVETPPDTTPLPIASDRVSHDTDARTTRIDIDFGHRNARPAWIRFDFREEAFRRGYVLMGRNEITTTVRRGRTETGDPIVRTIDAPWRRLASGTFFRLPAGRSGEEAIDRTRIELDGVAARYLRVVINDHDDRPLRLRQVEAHAQVQRLVFPLRPRGMYSLYYGNPEAAAPRYDLPALLHDLDERPPALAMLGPPGANPLFGGAPARPFTERHAWLLWIVLLIAVAVLATVVARNMKGAAARGA